MTLDAAEKAGAAVKVVGWMHPQAYWVHQTYGYVMAHCQRGGQLPIPLVPLSELDTARAEIERLREAWGEADAIVEACASARDEAGYLGKIDDCIRSLDKDLGVVAGQRDYVMKALEAKDAALTAAQERIAELEGAGAGVIKSWDDRQHGQIEQLKHSDEGGFDYWSPSASMVSSEAIAALRATLSSAVKENDRGEHVP